MQLCLRTTDSGGDYAGVRRIGGAIQPPLKACRYMKPRRPTALALMRAAIAKARNESLAAVPVAVTDGPDSVMTPPAVTRSRRQRRKTPAS